MEAGYNTSIVTLLVVEGDEMGILVSGGTTGPFCHWGYIDTRARSSKSGLEARMTALLCKKVLLRNPENLQWDGLIHNAIKSGMTF
jgi:hypothetical protein